MFLVSFLLIKTIFAARKTNTLGLLHNFESNRFLLPSLAFVFSFLITFVAIPSIIQVAQLKHLFDEPDSRKLHKSSVPTLGGLAIFAGIMISTLLFCDSAVFTDLQYVAAALLLVFFLGIKDDIIILSPFSKLLGQCLAAITIAWFGDIRIYSLGGVFGISNLPYEASIIFSALTILMIINSFNFIDGIDGLAGTISFITTSAYAAWFYKAGFIQPLILAMAAMGALLAFLRYNITPAKIFMGDTGSMIMGLIIAVLTIKFIYLNHSSPEEHRLRSAPVLSFGIMIIPLFDLLRVSFVRIMHRKSPFNADRIHIHHKLLELGMTHLQATLTLSMVNVFFIVFILGFQRYNITYLMLAIVFIAFILSFALWYLVKRKNKNEQQQN